MINPKDYIILVVEDSAIQAEMLRRTLAREGYQVRVAPDGAKAIDMVRTAKPSLIISDVSMPIMDGYQMCYEIKSDRQLRDIPVILLTDLSDPKDVIRGLNAKADNYVTKPWHDRLLLSRIECLLERPQIVEDESRTEPVELNYGGETYLLTSGPTQILNLLISTYENAVEQRRELVEAQQSLVATNDELDSKLRALRESEGRFEILVQMIPDIVYRIDNRGIFTFVNNAVSLIGYKPEDLIGKHFSEIILPSDVESVSADHVLPKYQGEITGTEGSPKLFDERRTGDRVTRNLEVRLVRRDSQDTSPAIVESIGTEVVSVEVSSSGMYEFTSKDTTGNRVGSLGVAVDKKEPYRYIGTVGAIRDVTDRKRTEAALLSSEERFRLLVQTAGSAIILLSPDNLIMELNHEAEFIFGHDRDSVLGHDFLNLFALEEQKSLIDDALEKTLGGAEIRNLETLIISSSGSFTMLWNMSLLFDKESNPIAIIAVGQDVTQWKKAEDKRMQAENEAKMARLSAKVATDTIEGMLDAVVLVASQGTILQFNRGFADSTGWGKEIIGTPLADYVSMDDADVIRAAFVACLSDERSAKNVECKIVARDGKKIPMLLNATVMNDSDESSQRIIAVFRDITERKQAEQEKESLRRQLFQAQKMESIGTLVGGIAHDFNNMLQVMVGYSDLLLSNKKEGEPGYRELLAISKTGKGGADLVKMLMAFSKQTTVFAVTLDLNDQIKHLITLISRTLSKDIEIDFDLAEGPATIRADHNQLEQVFVNLAINGAEAMPNGGRLKIVTKTTTLDDDYCSAHHGVKPGNYVMLSVSDTGRGMDRQTQTRMFDPFFSTKERGATRGTGLGLSVVQGIVEQQGGHINWISQPGKGTEFKVYFPAIEPPQKSGKETEQLQNVNENRTILLVESDQAVSDFGRRILTKSGHTVITASNGKEALEIHKTRKKEIALVILDFVTSEMYGRDLLMELLSVDPSVNVLLTSIHPSSDDLLEEIAPLVKGFLQKPFGVAELVTSVRSVLGQRIK